MPRKFVVALFVAIAVATYWNALHAPFVWDDDVAITTNQSIHDIGSSLNPPLETPMSGRPVANLSLALNYAIGDLDPTGYHAANLAILVVCALLLFGIVTRTIRRQAGADRNFEADGVALIAALVWMVHPLLSETIDYTTQRTESLMGLFFLLTLYASVRAHDSTRKKRKAAGRPAAWMAVAVGSCALGMATKESMAVAPLAGVLYDVVFEFESLSDAFAARRGFYAALAATWIELAAIMWRWPRSTVGAQTVGRVTYLINQAQMIGRYLWLTVWPHALVVDYGLPRSIPLGDVIPQIAVIGVLLVLTVVAFTRWLAFGFLGAMFFLTLAPTSSIVPIATEVGAERRMYLPLATLVVAVVLAAGAGIGWLFRHTSPHARGLLARRVGGAIAVIVVAALAARTVERNRDYASGLTLWQSVVNTKPQGRARFAFANELIEAGRHDDAMAQLRLAVADFPDANAGLGTELLIQGKLDEGIQVLQAFVDAHPTLANRAPARALLAKAHLALAQKALAEHDAGRAALEARQSIAFETANAEAHNVLGAALAATGDLAGGIAEFKTAVRLDPRFEPALNNLARATAILQHSR